MASVFTMIINGELPGHFVWKDDHAVAFMSINPLNRGHTLVVPRHETDHWIDLSSSLNKHLMGVSQHIATVQQRIFAPQRVGLLVAGFEVPHVHMHVIPIDSMAHLDFANAATAVDQADLAAAAQLIRSGLAEDGHSQASD